MRGHVNPQSKMFSYFSPDDRVPARHPLRSIKSYTDAALKAIRPTLDGMYSDMGRPSIPPERLLKAQLLIALYSVRSDRLFCETLDYNILFRWFLDMSLEEPAFDASTFSKNRERLAREEVALKFFDAVVRQARRLELLSDEHFSVDGTLIEAWASMKSFRPKDGGGSGPDAGGDRDFKGERRRNDTHASTSDPEAKLLRKAAGKEAKLCFAGHGLMDNRHGLMTDVALTVSVEVTEPQAALAMITRQRRKHLRPKSVGGDKGYHTQQFVTGLREHGTAAHVAFMEARNVGLGEGVRESAGYRASQIVRKRIEQFWGWGKTVGGLRKTRLRGVRRNAPLLALNGAAYNLLRISRLCPATG
ncbi:MAG: IS5 family transposase ISAzo31 [Steroidobacteraceae bacterium]|nr:IS5 family transposase ISAzo31 [Steroidobacteraceae bacterium]